MPSELDGVALVTGAGRGIGADIARELASAGMRVAVSARTSEQVEEVAREIGGLGVVGDVSRREDVERMVRETEEQLGPIDLLVANVASTPSPGGTCTRSTMRRRSWKAGSTQFFARI